MPPHISRDEDGFPKPFAFLHPGIGKSTFQEQIPQPHIFQQSVTLTASMWNENESSRNKDTWSFGNWGVLAQYSPLFVGIFCGFGIVLLVISTVMLWRYCLVSATKKVCCKSTYETPQSTSIAPLRKEQNDNQNGFENFHTKSEALQIHPTLKRSATVGSMPWKEACDGADNYVKLYGTNIRSNPYAGVALEPLMSQENLYTSHLYLHKLVRNRSEMPKNLARSTPALEDLYAKVNFSKKRKNRMRKDDAAVIALSKSHSGQNNNSLAVYGSAIVVYNERTAL